MARLAGVHLAVIFFVLKCVHFNLCKATESINMRGCGLSEPLDRISGGSPVKRNQMPWIVLLHIVGVQKSGLLSYVCCGGSIITKTVVLTAAHCFFYEDEKYEFYRVRVSYGDTDAEVIPIKIADRVIIHPEYTTFPNGYDIALVHVPEPFYVNEFVRPVCLPEYDITVTNKQVLAAGWRKDHFQRDPSYKLNYVFLRALSSGECSARLHNDDLEKLVPYMLYCTLTRGKDFCKAASGGPLNLRKGRRWFQVGVTSSGQHCSEDEEPIVYTRVSFFIDWIRDLLNQPELWTALSDP